MKETSTSLFAGLWATKSTHLPAFVLNVTSCGSSFLRFLYGLRRDESDVMPLGLNHRSLLSAAFHAAARHSERLGTIDFSAPHAV
jgi:hypothetical protein